MSYLTQRSMVLSFKGASSSSKPLPGSSPQGAFLGIFLFIVKFNAAALRPSIPRLPLRPACSALKNCRTANCQKHPKQIHATYIDDLSEGEAVNLRYQLSKDNSLRQQPLTFHERKGYVFKQQDSLLQRKLLEIESFTKENKMKINTEKTKIMLFNKSRNFDFPPEFSFENGILLETVEEVKLLGIQLSSNLSWDNHVKTIFKKAMSRMWLLRRMKVLRLEETIVLEYYLKEIRPLTEHAVVVWNPALTKAQTKDLERIQRIALVIILGSNFISYSSACKKFNLPTLSDRRELLCTNFAIKLYKSPRSDQFFEKAPVTNTRSKGRLVVESLCRTKRAYLAPHNYIRRLVNQNAHKIS